MYMYTLITCLSSAPAHANNNNYYYCCYYCYD